MLRLREVVVNIQQMHSEIRDSRDSIDNKHDSGDSPSKYKVCYRDDEVLIKSEIENNRIFDDDSD